MQVYLFLPGNQSVVAHPLLTLLLELRLCLQKTLKRLLPKSLRFLCTQTNINT